MDVEVIRGILLCTQNQQDFWAWHFEKMGVFTVRSAYKVLATVKKSREDWLDQRPAVSTSEEKLWTKLWKCKVPSKIHIFLWSLVQCSLPTGDVRHHR
jgi:hypothetical protein